MARRNFEKVRFASFGEYEGANLQVTNNEALLFVSLVISALRNRIPAFLEKLFVLLLRGILRRAGVTFEGGLRLVISMQHLVSNE